MHIVCLQSFLFCKEEKNAAAVDTIKTFTICDYNSEQEGGFFVFIFVTKLHGE